MFSQQCIHKHRENMKALPVVKIQGNIYSYELIITGALASRSRSLCVHVAVCVFLSFCLWLCRPVCLAIARCVCRLALLRVCRSDGLDNWRSVDLSVCRFFLLSTCRFVRLSSCLSDWVCLSVKFFYQPTFEHNPFAYNEVFGNIYVHCLFVLPDI